MQSLPPQRRQRRDPELVRLRELFQRSLNVTLTHNRIRMHLLVSTVLGIFLALLIGDQQGKGITEGPLITIDLSDSNRRRRNATRNVPNAIDACSEVFIANMNRRNREAGRSLHLLCQIARTTVIPLQAAKNNGLASTNKRQRRRIMRMS